ncbi:DUF547 domain-containing protein [uncultured Croceitalea sp.]|uniref:DUF547 domain-containing protein n=1 Tax=uncultured Croceitalea sp. TaxID=1798908 RepID=UPI003305E6F6
MRSSVLAICLLTLCSCCKVKQVNFKKSTETTDYNVLSEEFLLRLKKGEDTEEIRNTLANMTIDELDKVLGSDTQRLAFWLNIYNAYIQVILTEHPEYYDDRSDFFSREQIPLAGQTISFSKIEHGIIRKSQWELGLGYFRKAFPDKFERKLRVNKRDYRVHFALNCGAKDCPPVAIYTPERLEEQLSNATKTYLKNSSDYSARTNTVAVTSLFSWFRGDFGGKKGVKRILNEHDIIATIKGVDLTYKDYDWTLALNNFIDL